MRENDSPLAATITCVSFLKIDSKEETSETGTPLSGIAVGTESVRQLAEATLTDGNIDEKNKCVMVPQTMPSAMVRRIKSHRNRFFTVSSFRNFNLTPFSLRS